MGAVVAVRQDREVKLERLRWAVFQKIQNEVLDTVKSVEVLADVVADSIVVEAHGFVLAERGKPVRFHYPADWWQAVKQRWFPRWALRRWPVRNTERVLEPMTLYPHFKISLPDKQPVLRLREIGPLYGGDGE